MNYANFVLLLVDSNASQNDVVRLQRDRWAPKHRGGATPYCHHLCYHQHPVHLERGTQKGSKMSENVEDVVGGWRENLVEVTATFYHSH
jgi:hypothetical protein